MRWKYPKRLSPVSLFFSPCLVSDSSSEFDFGYSHASNPRACLPRNNLKNYSGSSISIPFLSGVHSKFTVNGTSLQLIILYWLPDNNGQEFRGC